MAIYAIPQGHGPSYNQVAAPARDAFKAKQIKLCGAVADEFQLVLPTPNVGVGIEDLCFGRASMSGRVENKVVVVTSDKWHWIGDCKTARSGGSQGFVTGRRSPELAAAIEQIGHGAVGIDGGMVQI